MLKYALVLLNKGFLAHQHASHYNKAINDKTYNYSYNKGDLRVIGPPVY